MKLFKIYLIIFATVLTVIIISRFFPHTYNVERSIVIEKPVSEVFVYMSNLKNWEEWSLWNKSIDSTLNYFYNKRPDTLGGRQYIRGERVGNGYFEITGYKKDSLLRFALSFEHGDRTASGAFTFASHSPGSTTLTWTDSGDVGGNPIKRFMIPFVTKNTATTLETGLASIKKQIEK